MTFKFVGVASISFHFFFYLHPFCYRLFIYPSFASNYYWLQFLIVVSHCLYMLTTPHIYLFNIPLLLCYLPTLSPSLFLLFCCYALSCNIPCSPSFIILLTTLYNLCYMNLSLIHMHSYIHTYMHTYIHTYIHTYQKKNNKGVP